MIHSTISALIDGSTGFGSFLLSSIKSHMETNAKRLHEERVQRLQEQKSFVSDTNKARQASGFIGWTRRIISLMIALYLFSALLVAFKGIPLVYPVTHSFSLWGLSWTSTTLHKVIGFLYFPWFQQLIFLVAGFYYGRGQSV